MEYSFTTARINKDLKTILSQFVDAYQIAADSSRNVYLRTLAPGSPVPKEGVIYGDDKREEFRSIVDDYREKAFSTVDGVYNTLKDKATEAPSTDAVNSITLLNMRKDITENEVEDLLNRYGDNVQAYSTINSIAKDHGIKVFKDNSIGKDLEDVEEVRSLLDKFINYERATSGRASDGLKSMIELKIDETFPTE